MANIFTNELSEEIYEYLNRSKDIKIEDHVLFIGYQEIGQEDETLQVKLITTTQEVEPLIKRVLSDFNNPNAINMSFEKTKLNFLANQNLIDKIMLYIIEKLEKIIDLKIVTLISILQDQSKHSFSKLTNLISVRSTQNKEDLLYFFERMQDKDKTEQLNQETIDAINTPHEDYTEYKI